MAGRKRTQVRSQDVTGLKYFEKLTPLLERLHDDGCARDRAGNRKLHYDQYCLLLLLYLFNPIVTSLRGLQQASELANVQKKLRCSRSALGSLSEATSVFDPQRLQAIIAQFRRAGSRLPSLSFPRVQRSGEWESLNFDRWLMAGVCPVGLGCGSYPPPFPRTKDDYGEASWSYECQATA